MIKCLICLLLYPHHITCSPAPGEWDERLDQRFCPLPARCEVDFHTKLSDEEFEVQYREKRPVVLSDLTDAWRSRRSDAWSRRHFITKYGKLQVGVGESAEIVSHAGTSPNRTTLETYVLKDKAEGHYAFDGDFFGQSDLASDMLNDCQPLPQSIRRLVGKFANGTTRSQRYLGLGRLGSGVGWHSHIEGWLFQLRGNKRIFLYPPHIFPPLEMPSYRNQQDWINEILPRLFEPPITNPPQQVILRPGDTLYIPSGWHHATLNCGDAVSLAIQVRPQEPVINLDHMLFATNIAQGSQWVLENRLKEQQQHQKKLKHEINRFKKMTGRLLKKIISSSPLRVHPRLWYTEYLHDIGGTKNNALALTHARKAVSLSPYVPKVRMTHAWCLSVCMRDRAVSYVNATQSANKARNRVERETSMENRAVERAHLFELTKEWIQTLDTCILLDPESPLSIEKIVQYVTQYRRVFPNSLRSEFEALLEESKNVSRYFAHHS